MAKLETEQKKLQRKLREQKELARREKQLGKRHSAGYLVYLLVILSIIYIVDEVASNMSSSMQAEVVTEFFVRGQSMDYTDGLGKFNLMCMPLYCIMAFMPFYRSLADRFGRKPFLVINTVGMGVGMAICMISANEWMFIAGMVVINFFMYNDVQVMYVMECAPEKHRLKLTTLTKGIGLLGVTAIPLLRDIFMGNDGTLWRKVYLFPAVIGIAVGLISMALMSETPAFLKKRVDYLSATDEDRAAQEKKASPEDKGGVIRAVKFMVSHRQIRNVALCAMIFMAATGITNNYASIMQEGGMDTTQVTQAMYFPPFIYAAITTVSGFINDALGRKKTAVIFSCLAFVGLTAFVVCAYMGMSPVVVGISYGCFIGGLWSVADMLCLVIAGESTPTHLRASVLGTMAMTAVLGVAVSVGIVAVAGMLDVALGWAFLVASAPFMLLAIIILIARVQETRHVDLNTVTGAEWD